MEQSVYVLPEIMNKDGRGASASLFGLSPDHHCDMQIK